MTEAEAQRQVALAQEIATEAHEGQTDKLGQPYIDHPRRVAERLQHPVEQAAAWLHDVVEDNEAWTADRLRERGIDQEVIDAVELLTREKAVPEDIYYSRIAQSPVPRAVKLADLADNTDPARRERLEPEVRRRLGVRYAHAHVALGADVPQSLRAELEQEETR